MIFGISGVIGSGKSTLCKILRDEHGFEWIEADKIVHELYLPGREGYNKIKDYFGSEFVDERGVRRGRLRAFVLGMHQKLWILNQMIHPIVVQGLNKKIVQLTKARVKNICIEAFYFSPTDTGKLIDRLLVVQASDEVILSRYKKLPMPQKQFVKMLYFQKKNLPPKYEHIKNEGTLDDLRAVAVKLATS